MTNIVRDDFDYVDPVVFSPGQLVSSSKLVRSLGAYLDKTKKRPIFITREQEVEAVLINVEEYRELLEEEAKVEDLYHTVIALRRLIEHVKSGKELLDADDVLREFGFTRSDIMGVGMGNEEVEG